MLYVASLAGTNKITVVFLITVDQERCTFLEAYHPC